MCCLLVVGGGSPWNHCTRPCICGVGRIYRGFISRYVCFPFPLL